MPTPAELNEASEGLQYPLTLIGSWTAARWDQWLRHMYGDEKAQRMIDTLRELGVK